jgi:hypothetical protein
MGKTKVKNAQSFDAEPVPIALFAAQIGRCRNTAVKVATDAEALRWIDAERYVDGSKASDIAWALELLGVLFRMRTGSPYQEATLAHDFRGRARDRVSR